MTLDGTNTWIVGDPAVTAPVVIDPGPDEPAHLDAVLAAAGGRIAVILLTHRHADHSAGAARLAARAHCGVRAADPAFRIGTDGLADGDRLEVGAQVLSGLSTPGHTDDSVCLLLTGSSGPPWLLTGDSVLGRGTSVIAEPDGDLAAYLASLERIRELIRSREVARLLPGHGPVIDRPTEVVDSYLAHRMERLEQVREAVRRGARTAAEVVSVVYADVDRALWPAAEQSVNAQLRYLETHD
jgi:glyoxylase-like metal-dependent hydrolase (beta-lactamase superfamily II)